MAEKYQTIVFLMRHGQTETVAKLDAEHDYLRLLNEEGREQAKKVGEYLEAFAPAAIYASPAERTRVTAQIIKETAQIPGQVIIKDELAEVYERADFLANPQEEQIVKKIIASHFGEQIVVVSHMLPIEESLKGFEFSEDEVNHPCRMSEGYRIVFAGLNPVECQKINPAKL